MTCLVGIESVGVKSWEIMTEAFRLIQKVGEVKKVSSVYLNIKENRKKLEDPDRNLTVAILLETEFSPRELAFLLLSSTPMTALQDRKLQLLAYEELFLMTPDLTLPHPDLHSQVKWIIPASEVAGNVSHPVLGMTLEELARPVQHKGKLEFYSLGKALLDFSSAKN